MARIDQECAAAVRVAAAGSSTRYVEADRSRIALVQVTICVFAEHKEPAMTAYDHYDFRRDMQNWTSPLSVESVSL